MEEIQNFTFQVLAPLQNKLKVFSLGLKGQVL